MLSKLSQETLDELKAKLPSKYTPAIIEAYETRYSKPLSRWTVIRFFQGKTYTMQLHNAILDVAYAQQSLNTQTAEIINA